MSQGFLPQCLSLVFLAAASPSVWAPAHAADPLQPPGFAPKPPSLHALTGARVFTRPGTIYSNATIVVREGRIESVGPDVAPPPGARIWDLSGLTVYPGFIEPYLVRGASNGPVNTTGSEPVSQSQLTSGAGSDPRFFGVPGQETDPGNPGPGSAIPDVTPQRRIAESYSPDAKLNESLRELGFTAANIAPGTGIFRGVSAAVSLGDAGPGRAILRPATAQHVTFAPAPGNEGYPNSLMGAIAVVRQTGLDARWYAQTLAASQAPKGPQAPDLNIALESLQPLTASPPQPVVFEPGSVLMADRAARLATELGWNPQIVASGQEWRRPDLLADIRAPFIVPLAFPAAPKLPDDADWEALPLDVLRQWDWAPENPATLRRAGLDIALTTYALADRKDFRKNLRAALDRGLSESDALASLTTVPARLCGLADQLGTIEAGRRAFLTVVAGSYFAPTSLVRSVWIDGVAFQFPPPKSEAKPDDKPAVKETEPKPSEPDRRLASSPGTHRGALVRPPAVLIRNATLWTSTDPAPLTNAQLFVRNGRIESIGPAPNPLPEGTLVIDGTGHHVTPGIIDCHSHSMILGAVNEATLPSTAMVRIADVINSETDNIHQQLAGGVTTVNLLHGSANPIGGQNCVIKLRDGQPPSGLVLTDAPPGIKFALGENVKQSNWGERNNTRFPQTRMGVGAFYVNRFTAARQYQEALDLWRNSNRSTPAPRRDLELEALAEILQGTRLIHCHSYRQDEILAFLRTMESFGIRVATLQHILEGYKVADEIARHGAGASAFADWWAYKFEVIDAIPYAGSLMHQRGVLVSFNSDSSDHARRLNFEAAKAVKYGGTSEADALRFVTLNPARQLRIDHRVGSLAPGRDADFAIWSGHPLDSSSLCLETWIDGARYFDRSLESARTTALRDEHTRLVAKARKSSKAPDKPSSPGSAKSDAARALFFQRALEHAQSLGVVDCKDCQLQTLSRP